MHFLSSVKGQDKALNQLKKAMTGNLSHAYLFVGPEGVGKMFTAKMWAYSLLAQFDEEGIIYLREGIHPDLLVIEKEENKALIGKERIVKDLEPWLALKPYRSKYRIAIIRDAHLLSMEAANALLKTLEEPPFYAVIILVADENSLLETIISRCQVIRFSPLNVETVKQILVEQGVEADLAGEAAGLGQGSISYALNFVKEELSENWSIARQIIVSLATDRDFSVYEAAEKMEENPQLITRMLETILRDILIYARTEEEGFLTVKENKNIATMLKRLNQDKLRQAIDKIGVLKGYYRRNVNSLIININICYAIKNALY